MDSSLETFQTWNSLAALYQEKFMNLRMYDESYSLFCDAIPQDKTQILELACGPGNITKNLLQLRPDFKILATDYAPEMVKLASLNNPKVDCKVLDSRHMRELNTRFHGIMAGFCIPYLNTQECQKFIHDSAHCLHPGGVLYISFVEGNSELSGFKTGSTGLRAYFYYHPLANLFDWFSKYGFNLIHSLKIPYPNPDSEEFHTVLIAKLNECNAA